MMNDSVREELHSSLTPVSGQLRPANDAEKALGGAAKLAPPPQHVFLEKSAFIKPPGHTTGPRASAPAVKPVRTAPLPSSRTSPTLVDFQAKNATVPEWRLQVQNAVRQRLGSSADCNPHQPDTGATRPPLATRGATALKSEQLPVTDPLPELVDADPRLTAALRRIQDSRKTFLAPEPKQSAPAKSEAKQFPFNVVTQTPAAEQKVHRREAVTAERARPSMVTPLRMEKKLDTNKLPLIETIVSTPAATSVVAEAASSEEVSPSRVSAPLGMPEDHRIVITAETKDDDASDIDEFVEEIEDLAPFSMRFNAGLFDLIIGIFASLVLLSPIALTGSSWLTTAGLLTFAGTCAIVMFLYTTMSVGFFGKTLGMRLFALELVDAEGNEYPTIRQAAVSSSLYVLSLLFGGLGFVAIFFNEEKRAVHDLLSGTIIVREF